MSLYITSLNSGSNGNCYYVGTSTEAILIDAGISCRETEKRLKRLGLPTDNIKAIFVSHEHKDHISGIPILSNKYQLPVYVTESTQANGRLRLDKHLVMRFRANQTIRIGTISVTAFSKIHDAGDPHSFVVSCENVCVGIFTDIGVACSEVIGRFRQCHAAFLESNYDKDMLENGGYPYYLKKRISDGKGHLSNDQALDLFRKHRPSFMTHLILSHLSKNNNDPVIVKDLFAKHAGQTQIVIASRDEESAIFHIHGSRQPVPQRMIASEQLSLF